MDETLLDTVIEATGLPQELLKPRLIEHVLTLGKNPASLTLEELREVIVPLLQDLFSEIADGDNQYITLGRR